MKYVIIMLMIMIVMMIMMTMIMIMMMMKIYQVRSRKADLVQGYEHGHHGLFPLIL